ncbi:hypothetical protein Dimus_013279, partial [Dionaea muscipula]
SRPYFCPLTSFDIRSSCSTRYDFTFGGYSLFHEKSYNCKIKHLHCPSPGIKPSFPVKVRERCRSSLHNKDMFSD